jgi:hypothetical protein
MDSRRPPPGAAGWRWPPFGGAGGAFVRSWTLATVAGLLVGGVAEDAVEIVVIGGPLLLPQVLNPDAPLTGSRLLLDPRFSAAQRAVHALVGGAAVGAALAAFQLSLLRRAGAGVRPAVWLAAAAAACGVAAALPGGGLAAPVAWAAAAGAVLAAARPGTVQECAGHALRWAAAAALAVVAWVVLRAVVLGPLEPADAGPVVSLLLGVLRSAELGLLLGLATGSLAAAALFRGPGPAARAPAGGPETDEPAVTNRRADLYGDGGRPGDLAGALAAGTPVTVLRRSGTWARVRTADGAQGYVVTEDLDPAPRPARAGRG